MSGTILIIEDDNDFAESLKLKIEEEDLQATVRIENFEGGMDQLAAIEPAVLVLDIFQGIIQQDKRAGFIIFQERVWNKCFTPVIFASASPEQDIIEFSAKHPLLNYIVKNKGETIDEIVENIKLFLPFGKGIKNIKTALLSDTDNITQIALTQTAPHILIGDLNPHNHIPFLENAARRRLAALLRLKAEQEIKPIIPWEQYLYPPPVSFYLLTGDVLMLHEGDWKDPHNYRVVLSPSCDLAQCKIEHVLTGVCIPLKERFDKIISSKRERAIKDLPRTLNQAQADGYAILPAYPNLIPPMAISLRNLELLKIKITTNGDIEAVSSDEREFRRVLSIDSPFREQLAWAYLEIACRPGMPDRNMEAWANEIFDAVFPAEAKKND